MAYKWRLKSWVELSFLNGQISKKKIDEHLSTFYLKAPDRNPQSIKIQGHLPDRMDISWEVGETANAPVKQS